MAKHLSGNNAIYKSSYIINSLKKEWDLLTSESKDHFYFKEFESPIQLNLGIISGGDINATLANNVILEGAIGFLSNKSMDNIKSLLHNAIKKGISHYEKEFNLIDTQGYSLSFDKLHNDPYEITENYYVSKLRKSHKKFVTNKIQGIGFPASCDSRLFFCRNNIPVVVLGCGDLSLAHSENEKVNVTEMLETIDLITDFINSV